MKAHDIKRLVACYVKKFNTRDPFELAEYLNVEVQTGPLGNRAGCYMFLRKEGFLLYTNKNRLLTAIRNRLWNISEEIH